MYLKDDFDCTEQGPLAGRFWVWQESFNSHRTNNISCLNDQLSAYEDAARHIELRNVNLLLLA